MTSPTTVQSCESTSLFQVKRVSHRFSTLPALTDINLTIGAGGRVAIAGPSGAGKSTLLRLLNGTLMPTTGEVWAFGKNLLHLSPRELRRVQQSIGTIYQQFHLVDPLRVIHNVNAGHLGRWSLAKALWSLVVPQEVAKARSALEQVGIPDKLYARTDQLSGGQQQRVALARVLVQNPIAVLADEPIASLDPERGREILALLCDLCEWGDRTLVVSLHAPELAQQYCDRIIGVRQGRILFDCPAAHVTSEEFAALYQLDSAAHLDAVANPNF